MDHIGRRHFMMGLGGVSTAALAGSGVAAVPETIAPQPGDALPARADRPAYDYRAFRDFHAGSIDGQSSSEKEMRYRNLRPTEFNLSAIIARTGPISFFPEAGPASRALAAALIVHGHLGPMRLDTYVDHPQSQIDGIIIAHKGKILYEAYPRMQSSDRHLLYSVTKPLVGLCVALLDEAGLVDVRKPIEIYLPQLEGSGWEGVAIRDILDHSSGIEAIEDGVEYSADPDAPIFRVLNSIYTLDRSKKSTFGILATLRRAKAPATAYEYTSVNSIILAWLVETVCNAPLATVISERIWRHVGAEHDGSLAISPFGAPGADGGISVSLRDVARFGLLYTRSGRVDRPPLVSDRHLATLLEGGRSALYATSERSRAPELQADPPLYNNWLWDRVWADGDFYKNGWGGQGLHVSSKGDGVIAFFGTGRNGNDGTHNLRWIARAIAVTLFKH